MKKEKTKPVKEDTKEKGKLKAEPKSFKGKWYSKSALKDRFKPQTTFLIEMKHTNGTLSHFIMAVNVHKFNYNGNTYVIDEERKIYCNTTKVYMLRYHEGFALPFNFDVTSIELKSALPSNKDIQEIATAYNPSVLKDILKFEYAKGVIQGAAIHEFLKRVYIIGIITLVGVIGHLLLAAYKNSWI